MIVKDAKGQKLKIGDCIYFRANDINFFTYIDHFVCDKCWGYWIKNGIKEKRQTFMESHLVEKVNGINSSIVI